MERLHRVAADVARARGSGAVPAPAFAAGRNLTRAVASPARRRLPVVIATSVIRSTHQGQSHGGVYLIDLESEDVRQVIDWDSCSIDWEGRGGDRGLRGIAFHGDRVILAASNEIFVSDPDFKLIDRVSCRYLKWCHEICIHDGVLYMSSTGFDSILRFDLERWRFLPGFCLRSPDLGPGGRLARKVLRRGGLLLHRFDRSLHHGYLRSLRPHAFDPLGADGPRPADMFHINHVFADADGIHLCGTVLDGLYRLRADRVERICAVPLGTHNTRLIDGRLVYQDTCRDRVGIMPLEGGPAEHYPLPRYPRHQLRHAELGRDHARQAFGRGLCLADDGNLIIAGSAPATITVFRRGRAAPLKSINLTMDVRNAIHGLEVWPFAGAPGQAAAVRSTRAGVAAGAP